MKPIFSCLILIASLMVSVSRAEIFKADTVEQLQAALDKALPEDIIQLRPGKYTLDKPLVFRKGGLGSQPVTVLATEKGRAVFTGAFGFVFNDISSIQLEGLVFYAIKQPCVLSLNSSRNIRIIACEFHKCGPVAIQAPVDDLHIPPLFMEGCYFRHCVGVDDLMALRAESNRLINNTFDTCGGTLRFSGDRNQLRGNYFIGSAPGGLAIHLLGNKNVFTNQYLHEVQAPSLRRGVVDAGQVRESSFGHNTWYHCSTPVFVLGEEGQLSAKNTFANNLIQNHPAETAPVIELSSGVVDLMWANNLLYDPAGQSNLVVGATVTFLSDNPKLVETNGVWRASAESPAVDAGTGRTGSSMMDIEGRVRGLRPDIGAHEISRENPSLERITSIYFK
ncbi:MAG: hypothetical protein ACI9TH_002454 [Kiritimatiellia bacterium]|jgi:hypothetical protein